MEEDDQILEIKMEKYNGDNYDNYDNYDNE